MEYTQPTHPSSLCDGLIRVKDAAEFMALSRMQVYRLMDSGTLPWVSLGDARRLPVRAVIDFVNAGFHPRKGE
jgi:excisionase family DNA binding protein